MVGLGNPGARYAWTRHNAGWHVIDRLCERLAAPEKKRSPDGIVWGPCFASEKRFFLLKPMTFMNLSGIAVKSVTSMLGLDLADILVVYDDVALPFGKIRLRPGGSAGGHKGMLSVIGHLGSGEFARLRIGIGGEYPVEDLSDYVTEPFSPREREALQGVCERAVDAVLLWLLRGTEDSMRDTNAPPGKEPGGDY
ncbi:MAG: aminoacyl-tRNA hydrolase [Thermovirgaceae bacterium]|nr:aminoacyl-tRNA hydrolase [Thermovirgaceae bacterium]